MLPSNPSDQNVKLRHRNDVTATATTTVGLPAGGQCNNSRNPALCKENSVKEKHWDIISSSSKHFDFFSNLSSDENECYMTHRRQTLSESSDDSRINDDAALTGNKFIRKSSNNFAATMRPSDLQRQTSISHLDNDTEIPAKCTKARTCNVFLEVAIRVLLIASFVRMEQMPAFKRIIHPEEIWLYKNPVSDEYVPASTFLIGVMSAPLVLIIGTYILTRDRSDFIQANYAFTLAIGMNGFLTSLVKISVGRPRPDFFFRCYPDGVMVNNFDYCTGDPQVVNEGRKSFPSGHSSMSFAGLGFMFFYLASKLHIFNPRGRGHAWRMCIAMSPLIVAAGVAISRTCDYRHHYQDVVAGSLLGICTSYLSYRQQMERVTAFKRIIHPEEVWLYKNPVSKEYVPASVILVAVISAPLVLIIGSFLLSRDRKDFIRASYAFTLAIGLNGFLTSLIKISVGRPRPDFFFRCYPDGVMVNNFDHCTGDPQAVNEGRKSFPSGHSSMAFAGFGFMFFYLASKLHIFNDRGRGHTWRLCLAIAPLVVAAEVAISRTCDYRHHWQDVVVGSLIGICMSYISYRQYFPSIFARNCHRSYPRSARISTNQVNCFVPPTGLEDADENQPLIGGEKDNKWI